MITHNARFQGRSIQAYADETGARGVTLDMNTTEGGYWEMTIEEALSLIGVLRHAVMEASSR